LQPQEARRLALERLRPYELLISHPNEFRDNPQSTSLSAERALDQIVDAELLPNLATVFVVPL
jgi:hypothetical protein